MTQSRMIRKYIALFNNSTALKIFRNLIGCAAAALEHTDKSSGLKFIRRTVEAVTPRDVGFFIVLTVLFNTLASLMFRRPIDIMSAVMRLLFILLGERLILKDKKRSIRGYRRGA